VCGSQQLFLEHGVYICSCIASVAFARWRTVFGGGLRFPTTFCFLCLLLVYLLVLSSAETGCLVHLLFICLLSPHEPGPRLRSHRHECPYIRVPVNTRLNAFQLWSYSFTLIRVVYEYTLPVNFTRTSSFCAGRIFIQPLWNKQHTICISLIYTGHDAYLTS